MTRRGFACLLLALAACGPEVSAPGTVTIAQYRSGLTMAAAGGCDTSIASGLSAQLVEELNCVTPNLMVDFSGPHVTLYSAVLPYLAPDAAQDLEAATLAQNDTMTISSAYRTLGQQYLLYKWWQAGQCGIQVAAVPGSSNHQSGRAIDTPYYSTWKPALTARGWTWLGSADLVHFDHLASPNIASTSILAFQKLWNKNHATGQLSEDGSWGPNTESAMSQAPTSGFAVHGCVTTGKLAGTITQQGTTTPLSGVSVSVGASSVTTTATGAFEFTLGAGPVTVTAAKAGFTPTSVTRTVQVGNTVSASMALSPLGANATLAGTVVEAASPGTPVASASVTVAGRALTTDASGAFQAVLPAGTVTVTVSKAGYVVNTSAVPLIAGQTKTVQISLATSTGDQPPVLELSSPAPFTSFDLSRIVVAGVAADDSGPLTSLQLVQNGAAAVTWPLVGGAFEVPVLLAPGLNALEFSVSDPAGHTTRVTWTGAFRAGFSGLVHRFDDAAAVIVDADLTLFDPDTQVALGTARSGPDGRFELEASAARLARLHVEKAGFTPRDLLVDVSAEQRTALDVGLTPGDVAELRFLEPSTEGPFEAEEITVSGVVTGFEVAQVTVNGQPATLLGSGFVAHLPLPEGRTVFEAIAEGAGGQSVRGQVVARRPMRDVVGGCGAAPGGSLAALGLLLLLRQRLRRCASASPMRFS